jgi:type I restriction enzyme S subunit
MYDKQVENARPNLSMGSIALFNIPLPPLAEQHRIVAKIDQLMTLCDELEKQIDIANSKKTNLLNSVMTKV